MTQNITDWTVRTVRLVTHTQGPVGDQGMSENHWSIYLLVDSNKSVRLNMSAEPSYIDGNFSYTAHDYQESRSSIRAWDYAAIGPFTAGQAIAVLLSYGMTGTICLVVVRVVGSGCECTNQAELLALLLTSDMVRCRFNVISLFRSLGWISPRSREHSWQILHFKYGASGTSRPIAMVQGSFY